MSRIRRDDFIDQLGSGPSLEVDDLGGSTTTLLRERRLDKAELARIAGDDGVIGGRAELGRLFDEVDRVDANGSYRSIDTTVLDETGTLVPTESGKLYEALLGERERVRLSGGRPPETASVAPPTDNSKPTRNAGGARGTATAGDLANAHVTLEKAGFSEVHIAPGTPYFNQADKAWRDHQYPKSPAEVDAHGAPVKRPLSQAGCAPTALAIADGALRGAGTTPIDVADFAVQRRLSGRPGGHGSDTPGMVKAWAKEHGLEYTPARKREAHENVDVLRDGLRNGGVAVISVGVDDKTGEGHFTARSHVMVINGFAVDKAGTEWFFIVNPGRDDQRTGKGLTTDDSVIQDRSLHHGAGQLRISRKQLEAEMNSGFVLSRPSSNETPSP